MSKTLNLAKSIVVTLHNAGHTAYYAGGWVRDYLRGETPSEIDIATSATPSIIQSLFEKTIPVGVSFGVVIVVLREQHFEVTTFRKDHPYHDGRHPEGVDYSTPEKDALRRDFTINGMFYDPLSERLYDFVGGREDLKNHLIRAIGDPEERFTEDRLRMIRAIRFAARLDFTIEEKTLLAIQHHATYLFPSVSIERIWQEFTKMALYPRFEKALCEMHRVGLLQVIFPDLREISHSTIEERTSPFPYFPKECPPIVYILELFPGYGPQKIEDLCNYLHLSKKDKNLALFFDFANLLFNAPSPSRSEWAQFYAHPQSALFLAITGAKILPPQKNAFFKGHEERMNVLHAHIKRLKSNTPLVRASLLKREGVLPGKKMGLLIKEGEKIAIEENCSYPEEVLTILKRSPLWPK